MSPKSPSPQNESSQNGLSNSRLFFVGIDVGKSTVEVALLVKDGTASEEALRREVLEGPDPRDARIPVRSVPNTEAGVDQLHAALLAAGASPDRTRVCLEASGGYERALLHRLHALGWSVARVNPSRTSAFGRAELRRHKTDATDARLLARFAHQQAPAAWTPPEPCRADLKELQRALDALKKQRAQMRVRRDHAAHDGVRRAYDEVLAALDRQVDDLKQQIDDAVAASDTLARQRALLETIPGIGRTAATSVLAELGDPSRFRGARQAAAYAGLTPSHHTSGTSVRKRPRLSKIGASRLRKALYFPALTALRHNRAVAALGDRLAERGKAKMVIVGAAMRKLLHICYGVLKNDEPFNAALHPGT